MLKAECFSRTLVLTLILSVSVAGQTSVSNWASVRMIAPGTQVRVGAANPAAVRGRLESVSDDALIITNAAGTASYQRPDVHSVAVRKKGHRLRNMFIGMGAGTAAGAGFGGAQASGCRDFLCGLALPFDAAIGFVVGTVTGLVWPTGGWRQVYAQ